MNRNKMTTEEKRLAACRAAKKYRESNKDKVKKLHGQWMKKNASVVEKDQKEYYQLNKLRVRDNYLKRTFGISLEGYNNLLKQQNNGCALCGGGPACRGKGFAVDHCHVTGKIRGLLCRGCNVGIGNLNDDPELLEKAAAYIRRHK
jgi:hypothetical protein